jgi:spore germination protein YaaH
MLLLSFMSLLLSVPNQQVVSPYPATSTSLVIKADKVACNQAPPIVQNNQVLLPIEMIQKYFDPTILWDEKLRRVVTTSQTKVVKLKLNSRTAIVNNKPLQMKVSSKNVFGHIYIPITYLSDVYGIDIKYHKPKNVVVIDYKNKIPRTAKVTKMVASVRKSIFAASPIVQNLKLGEELKVFNANENWYKVRSEQGIVGYIQRSDTILEPLVLAKKPKPKNTKLVLAWHQSTNSQSINKVNGLDILSPTWFSISDSHGTVKSRASYDYVKKAHKYGYKVWALFSNSFSPIITTDVLNNGLLRDKVIKQIVYYAKLYHLDGINIDFENMHIEDKDAFSQFVRELTPLLRNQGQVVSVDIGTPDGGEFFSMCFDRKALSNVVDYVALMTYDQHWSNCPYSGSVAQYSWVEEKLQRTLDDVPASKLLLGIPFYIRGFKEEFNPDGTKKVTQYAVFTIDSARAEVKSNHADLRWDNESGQYYAEYSKNNATYKLWLEDAKSINLKSSLVQKYNLAGVAAWEKGYENPEVWKVIKSNIKDKKSYTQWANANKTLYSQLINSHYVSQR